MMYHWILFDAYDDYFTANLMQSKLRDEGFQCTLRDESTVNADPLLSNAVGGIKLMVLKEDSERIQEWYARYQLEVANMQICVRCKKTGVIKNPDKSKSTSVFAFFDAIFNHNHPKNRKYKCLNCGYRFDKMILIDRDFESETSD
jgi:hypothetical protein